MKTPFSNLTVPVDGSPTARRGIEYALGLAREGAKVHFCSVVDIMASGLSGSIGSPIDPVPIIEASEDDARFACSEAMAMAARSGVTADCKIIFGAITPAVCRYAQEVGSDAIVIGTNARRGVARVVFGSVAESLLATSTIPLVIVHSDDAAGTGGPLTVAVDGSAPSRAALALAIELAAILERGLAIESVTGTSREEWREASALLDDSADAARAAEVDFELITVAGRAADELVDDGQRRKSSAIVVGTGTHSKVARSSARQRGGGSHRTRAGPGHRGAGAMTAARTKVSVESEARCPFSIAEEYATEYLRRAEAGGPEATIRVPLAQAPCRLWPSRYDLVRALPSRRRRSRAQP